MRPRQIETDEQLFREMRDRFASPFGFGEYFRGGMGAAAIRDLLAAIDLERETDSCARPSRPPRASARRARSSG